MFYLLRKNYTVYTTDTSRENSIAQQCRFQTPLITMWSLSCWFCSAQGEHWFVSVPDLEPDTAPSQAPTLCLCLQPLLCNEEWNWSLIQQNLNFLLTKPILTTHCTLSWLLSATSPPQTSPALVTWLKPSDGSAGEFISWGASQSQDRSCSLGWISSLGSTSSSFLLWYETIHRDGGNMNCLQRVTNSDTLVAWGICKLLQAPLLSLLHIFWSMTQNNPTGTADLLLH